jgi:GDP-4-dehydro-6-deoxy-D-mannose reductase
VAIAAASDLNHGGKQVIERPDAAPRAEVELPQQSLGCRGSFHKFFAARSFCPVMKALVTGISGFVGLHLAEHLAGAGDQVIGISRHAPVRSVGLHVAADVLDRARLGEIVCQFRPDVVYHLAAQPNVAASFRDPAGTWRVNVEGTRILYDAIRDTGARCRVVFVSSAAVYGDAPSAGDHIDERTPLAPPNPYASSKAAADLLSFQYWASYGLDVVRVRPFNHVGPGQSPGFVVPDFARQLARIERSLDAPCLHVGDLRPVRDFTDVRDVVRAYRLAAIHGGAGSVYNVASGVGRSVEQVLEILRRSARCSVRVEQDPQRVRLADPRALVGNAGAFRTLTGWSPQIAIETTLADVLEDWRQRVVHEGST